MSNGATWLEGLARHFALTGNARPALGSNGPKASNYATAGARSVGYPCRFNLPDQLAAFTAAATPISPNTLVTIEMGGNDVRDALVLLATGGDFMGAINDAVTSLAVSINTLYGQGARHFLLMNVPDVGKTPAIRQLAAQLQNPLVLDYATMLSAAYNGGLQGVAGAYASAADIRILDAFGKLNAIIANPTAYGLVNVTEACITPGVPPFRCSKPDTYLFWDGIHPTKVVHKVLAQEAIGVMSAP
jgi:phospholipase/lecithinase/hemolysin